MNFDHSELAKALGSGLLTFPVTHFDGSLQFDEESFRNHCDWLLSYPFAGLFAAGGTGEFFSLSPTEVEQVTRAAVSQVRGKLPVIGSAGYGTAMACEMARAAERAGADGILLLPPYLVQAPQLGLENHISAVCSSTVLGVIVYARDNCRLEPETMARLCDQHPNLIGFKDGIGDIELFVGIKSRLEDRLTYIGGLPTAETFAPSFLAMGCTTYSSAIANFLPDFAMQFYDALRSENHELVESMLTDFVLPYVAIRNRANGFAVSIVKAGLELVGRPAGSVRPPLIDLARQDAEDLSALIASAGVLDRSQ